MTEKQYKLEQWSSLSLYYSFPDGNLHHSIGKVIARVENDLNSLYNENEQLQKKLNKLEKFEHGGEHIRLSINIETGELQRHIYATGQWFGDFDRVLVKNWISEEDYQRFINRIIEVYNTEFKKD